MPKDKPIVYFAMGSSGKPKIIADIIEGFKDKPFRVIAPVKAHIKEMNVKVSDNVILTKLISCQTKWQRVGHGKIYFLKNKIIYIPVIDSLVRKGNSILIINLKEIKNFELKTDKYSTKFYINLRKDTIKFFVINNQIDDYKNIAGTIGIRVIIK